MTHRIITFIGSVIVILGVALAAAPEADAQAFKFSFKNPGFGGHPSNSHYFFQSAESQKPDFGTPQSGATRSPIDDFQRNLQRQMLSQLSRQLVRGDLAEIDLSQEGVIDLGDFSIQVMPGLDNITIEILDQLSGERTQVEIPRF